jgi:O-antigen/teichoic acid export membrane protein
MKNKIAFIWGRINSVTPLGADAAATTLTNLLLGLLGMCSGILAARLLGPSGRGELAAIQTVPSVVGALAMIGMPEAVVYFSAREPEKAGTFLGSGTALAILASIPFVVVAYKLMPWILSAQKHTTVASARSYLWIVVLYATVGMLLHPLRGRNDFLSWNGLRLIVPVSWLSVLAVAWASNQITAPCVARLNLLATALLLFPFLFVTCRRVPGPYYFDSSQFRPMIAYGLPCMMTGLPQLLNLRLDQMLMAALLAPRALGLYVVAVAWSGAVAPLLNGVGAVILPSVASAGDRDRALSRFVEAAKLTSVLSVSVSCMVSIVTPLAIRVLFGYRFAASIPAAIVLVPAAGLLGLNFALAEGLRGLGSPYAVLQAEIVGLFATGGGLFLMLRSYGILGAALASLLGYATVCAVLLYNAHRVARITPTALLFYRRNEVRLGLGKLMSLAREVVASVN